MDAMGPDGPAAGRRNVFGAVEGVTVAEARYEQEDVRGLLAVAAYFLAVSALAFCATLTRLAGLDVVPSVLLPPLGAVGWAQTVWHTFWLAVLYYPVLLLPMLLFGVSRRAGWIFAQILCAGIHVAWWMVAW